VAKKEKEEARKNLESLAYDSASSSGYDPVAHFPLSPNEYQEYQANWKASHQRLAEASGITPEEQDEKWEAEAQYKGETD